MRKKTLVGQEMAAPRKVFRIEETAAARLERRSGTPDALPHAELMQALTAMRGVMSAAPSLTAKSDVARGESQWLGVEAEHLTRIAHELNAVTTGTGQATQKILAAAEEIDQFGEHSCGGAQRQDRARSGA